MRINHVLPNSKRNPYFPLKVFDPSTLPLEVAIKNGDKIWIGRNQPVGYKLWINSNIDGYETTIQVV